MGGATAEVNNSRKVCQFVQCASQSLQLLYPLLASPSRHGLGNRRPKTSSPTGWSSRTSSGPHTPGATNQVAGRGTCRRVSDAPKALVGRMNLRGSSTFMRVSKSPFAQPVESTNAANRSGTRAANGAPLNRISTRESSSHARRTSLPRADLRHRKAGRAACFDWNLARPKRLSGGIHRCESESTAYLQRTMQPPPGCKSRNSHRSRSPPSYRRLAFVTS